MLAALYYDASRFAGQCVLDRACPISAKGRAGAVVGDVIEAGIVEKGMVEGGVIKESGATKSKVHSST